jgi:hypothetical protein
VDNIQQLGPLLQHLGEDADKSGFDEERQKREILHSSCKTAANIELDEMSLLLNI